MLLRARGKGACPENSHATLMHLRGFRHTRSSPPLGAFTLLTLDPTLPAEQKEEGEKQERPGEGLRATLRPFRFPLFAMGLHCPGVVEAQVRFCTAAPGKAQDAEAEAEAAAALGLAWKEVWNMYDIAYDEVDLLPGSFEHAESELAALAAVKPSAVSTEAVNALVQEAAGAAAATGNRPSAVLPTSAAGLTAQLVVCAHYCAEKQWAIEAFSHTPLPAPATSVVRTEQQTEETAQHGVVVVVDLSEVRRAEAGQQLALELAWSTGFAALRRDNVWLRAGAVVVRLPYRRVPQLGDSTAGTTTSASLQGASEAYARMVDFLGQHLQHVWTASVRAVMGRNCSSTALVPTSGLLFVGAEETEFLSAVRHVLQQQQQQGCAEVVVLRTDRQQPGTPETAQRTFEDETCGRWAAHWGVAVRALVAPVRRLLENGEEPWDPYTQRERARLNFCPCCGITGGVEEGQGHGYSHGHGHTHD